MPLRRYFLRFIWTGEGFRMSIRRFFLRSLRAFPLLVAALFHDAPRLQPLRVARSSARRKRPIQLDDDLLSRRASFSPGESSYHQTESSWQHTGAALPARAASAAPPAGWLLTLRETCGLASSSPSRAALPPPLYSSLMRSAFFFAVRVPLPLSLALAPFCSRTRPSSFRRVLLLQLFAAILQQRVIFRLFFRSLRAAFFCA